MGSIFSVMRHHVMIHCLSYIILAKFIYYIWRKHSGDVWIYIIILESGRSHYHLLDLLLVAIYRGARMKDLHSFKSIKEVVR